MQCKFEMICDWKEAEVDIVRLTVAQNINPEDSMYFPSPTV